MWFVFAACQTDVPEKPTLSTTIPTDPTVGTTGTLPTTTDTTSSPTGTGTTPTGTGTTVDTAVRFVALGDAGEGNDAQYEVSLAIEQVCADRGGCDFALYLGDNFYDSGVSGIDDEQFETKFELPYANLDFPFFITIGNHDLGVEGLGLELWKADTYVEYTDYSDKWTMPGRYYGFEWGDIGFWGLDTTRVMYGVDGDQIDWLANELDTSKKPIKIVFGHHPYISNGQHGNAGEYEGIADWVPLTEIPRGEYLQEMFEDAVCGRATIYLSGHDHNMQWLEPTCGTEFIVSGVGAKVTDLEGRGNTTFFEDDTHEGFLFVEIDDGVFDGTFYDRTAAELFSMSVTL